MVDGEDGEDLRGGDGGRGNLRVAKTPPLQSGVCGDIIAIHMSPLPPPCAYTMPRMESHGFYNRHGTVREGTRGWAGN